MFVLFFLFFQFDLLISNIYVQFKKTVAPIKVWSMPSTVGVMFFCWIAHSNFIWFIRLKCTENRWNLQFMAFYFLDDVNILEPFNSASTWLHKWKVIHRWRRLNTFFWSFYRHEFSPLHLLSFQFLKTSRQNLHIIIHIFWQKIDQENDTMIYGTRSVPQYYFGFLFNVVVKYLNAFYLFLHP